MKRVLFLAYYFPPTGGAGTQRSAKFTRDLRALGFDPVVVTGPGPAKGVWTPADDSLMTDVPPETPVHRVRGPVPPSGGRAAAAARWLDSASPFKRWWLEGAEQAALEAVRAGGADVILASLSPYESGELAAALSRRLALPWIADLRDPWALDEMRGYPSAAHRRRDLLRMRAVLATADAIVMNTPEALARLRRRFPELGARRVVHVPNGWDARDFDVPAEPRADDAFRIVHTGSLHTEAGRRRPSRLRRALGGTAPINLLTRSHVYLQEAMRRVRLREPELGERLELHLAGNLTAADRDTAATTTIQRGYLPHQESVALLRSADLLFLPMQDLLGGGRATIVPGKTYEYLAAQRPVLAAVPQGDARDLVAAAPVAYLTAPDDVDAMTAALESELRHVREHGRRPDAPMPGIQRYERARLAADLAAVIEEVVRGYPLPAAA